MQLLPATRKRVSVFSLPPGGRWFLRSKKRKENAALAQNTRYKTSAFLSYTRAPPYAALRRFPSSRRRAFSQGLSALTFCLLLPHRHSLFSTTRLSRGFRFTKTRFVGETSCKKFPPHPFIQTHRYSRWVSTLYRFLKNPTVLGLPLTRGFRSARIEALGAISI